jgi:uncharacterized protein YchJ
MRSRYAALALGLGAYLVKTLAADHPDRALDEAALVRDLSRAKERQRFLGLAIVEAHDDGARGEVTFHAGISAGSRRSMGPRRPRTTLHSR